MRILDRYVCREVFSHSLLGLGVFTFVFFVPQLVRLMELIVQHSAGAANIILLFLCSLPPILVFTVPIGALVGVLIGLGRLSGDSEVVAMNASGIGLRRLLYPIGGLALLGALLTLAITVWIGPLSLRTLYSLEDRLRASQASLAVPPRVFEEQFPHWVLYVQDVDAAAAHWHGVLLANSNSSSESRITLAKDAIVIADPAWGKLLLHLENGSTHEFDPHDPQRYDVSTFATSDLPIEMAAPSPTRLAELSIPERSFWQLLETRGPDWRAARVELQRRLAFPAACLVFALLGVPLGVRPRRGGRATGFVVSLALVCGYYVVFVTGVHKAEQGSLSPALGVWAANILTGLVGLILLGQFEQIRGESHWLHWLHALREWRRRVRTHLAPPRSAVLGNVVVLNAPGVAARPRTAEVGRASGFPLLFDLYVLRTFCFWFILMLVACVLLFDSFTFFDLLQDISQHHIPAAVVGNFFRYQAFMMAYQLTPLAALVATLVTLGLLSKANEVTAFKACGVSLYRLALPLLLIGGLLAAGMFLLDDTYLPYANQKQDALWNEIKGRPAQTFFQPAHQWIFGEGDKLYNYELFDADRGFFGGLNVFELDPGNFQIRRRIYASRAQWEPSLNTWVLEGGWVRDFSGERVTRYLPFKAYSFPELTEPPSYFKRQVRQSYEMNWRQLGRYIRNLQQAGFDTSRLAVQWHKKFSFPAITPIIILLGIPFAFLVGARGAVGGLALGVSIAIVYWAAAALFEAMGTVGQLPPLLAGWAPGAIFLFVGIYFFLKMPT